MPRLNQFRHQPYPTVPVAQPTRHVLDADPGSVDFSRLHTRHAVRQVLLVHGTFAGDDPIGVSRTLRALAERLPAGRQVVENLADRIAEKTKEYVDSFVRDVGNWAEAFQLRFQELTGGDPVVARAEPGWSGQDHHFARAELAIRLLCHLDQQELHGNEQILLWGHSHAGNGFAILTNLLANDRPSVDRFFEACGHPDDSSWHRARDILQNGTSPHQLAKHVSIVTFGTPVRYGWDTSGCRRLFHVVFDRAPPDPSEFTTQPLFPPHAFRDMLNATWGDWIQAFAICGTDVVRPTPASVSRNRRLRELLEAGLEPPEIRGRVRLIPVQTIRWLCARWQTGTRCHADGFNLLVDYHPCGRSLLGRPIEESLFGHAVSTTIDWLPAHLNLLLERMDTEAQTQA